MGTTHIQQVSSGGSRSAGFLIQSPERGPSYQTLRYFVARAIFHTECAKVYDVRYFTGLG
jgi:hypothetical protein